jgi:hypothetical protein
MANTSGDELAKLEMEFENEVRAGIAQLKPKGYNPTGFLGMIVTHGSALKATKQLLAAPAEHTHDGFTRLWLMGKETKGKFGLNMSVEYMAAFVPKYAQLFTDEERETARVRLGRHDERGPTEPKVS